jgi:hypothetical protein
MQSESGEKTSVRVADIEVLSARFHGFDWGKFSLTIA